MIKVEAIGVSDIGKVRTLQEDSILINEGLHLYIVADGMGGHQAGEVASEMATTIINNKVEEFKTDTSPEDFIIKSVKIANSKIYEKSILEPDKKGMGTTVVLLYLYNNRYYIANVGDSRCYVLRDKKLVQITEDHSFVYEQYKKGLLKKEEMEKYPYRNIITRAVGISDELKVDLFIGELRKNDIYLLCSDGLYSEVADKNIKKILNKKDHLKNKVETLIKTAILNGGNDNISVIAVKILDIVADNDKTVIRKAITL